MGLPRESHESHITTSEMLLVSRLTLARRRGDGDTMPRIHAEQNDRDKKQYHGQQFQWNARTTTLIWRHNTLDDCGERERHFQSGFFA